jgi:hypothetical protein
VSYEDMVNFEFAFDINTLDPAVEEADALWLGAFGTFGPVSAEAYYYSNDDIYDVTPEPEEVFLVGAKGGYDVMEDLNISAAANFAFNLMDSPADGDKWDLGVGVKGAYGGLAALSVGMAGNDADIASLLTFELNVTPIDNMGIDAGLVFNMAEAAVDTFEELDVSAWYLLGATKLRVGYFAYNEDVVATVDGLAKGGMFAYNAGGPLPAGSGGIYVIADVSF